MSGTATTASVGRLVNQFRTEAGKAGSDHVFFFTEFIQLGLEGGAGGSGGGEEGSGGGGFNGDGGGGGGCNGAGEFRIRGGGSGEGDATICGNFERNRSKAGGIRDGCEVEYDDDGGDCVNGGDGDGRGGGDGDGGGNGGGGGEGAGGGGDEGGGGEGEGGGGEGEGGGGEGEGGGGEGEGGGGEYAGCGNEDFFFPRCSNISVCSVNGGGGNGGAGEGGEGEGGGGEGEGGGGEGANGGGGGAGGGGEYTGGGDRAYCFSFRCSNISVGAAESLSDRRASNASLICPESTSKGNLPRPTTSTTNVSVPPRQQMRHVILWSSEVLSGSALAFDLSCLRSSCFALVCLERA